MLRSFGRGLTSLLHHYINYQVDPPEPRKLEIIPYKVRTELQSIKLREEWIFNESQRGNNNRSETIIMEKSIDLSYG